uniref:Putative phytocyanin n=1 Tax=Pinus sylvestris TaxID=3349 RepID=B8RI16_PINSY|nr:putative phytocyanin [Pinus sylvestris]
MAAVRGQVLVALGACLALAVLQSVAATTYTVGGSAGWTIPATNAKLYTDWVKATTFKLGDMLVFKFATNVHNVYRVSKADYDKCVTTSPLEKYETGPASITLNTTGHHYYICAVSGHCAAGQKVSIKVSTAAAPGSSPSPAPVSSPATSASSPAPGSSTSSTTTSSSGSAPGSSPSKSGASHSVSSDAAIFMAILSGFAALFL